MTDLNNIVCFYITASFEYVTALLYHKKIRYLVPNLARHAESLWTSCHNGVHYSRRYLSVLKTREIFMRTSMTCALVRPLPQVSNVVRTKT